MKMSENISTGLPVLDRVLYNLRPGDNVVWRVDTIEDYVPFVKSFYENALKDKKKLTYFRFAKHHMLAKPNELVDVHDVNPERGFENFITVIHNKIKANGKGGFYIFDSMSDLGFDYFSDRMIGNFFKLTCPFLYKLNAVAYFSFFRYYHSYHAASSIAETTQLLLDVYRYKDKIYIQPSKVYRRYSPTMYMLHVWEKDEFRPIKESSMISDVLCSSPWPGLRSASYRMVGIWDKRFMHAEEVLDASKKEGYSAEKVNFIFEQLLKLAISRDKRVLELAKKYLTLADVIYIWKRMIGSGMIGGKSVGMLLARSILCKTNKKWESVLESHDSFFIGSDVFYTFLVENDCWWDRQKQKDPDAFLEGANEIRTKILDGVFPEYIVKRLADMLDYFGQSPIIVRSSSLLEDNFGNAFAGKYDSVFCINQGTHQKRLQKLLDAIRIIYASTMSEEALNYREKRGVLGKDEQMALLIQRVSGKQYGNYFYPQLAGVGFSFNPYVWNKNIDPDSGMMRLVFGLGTRAVDRSDDDYTRVVALNLPEKRPESNFDEVKRYSQRRVDLLNLKTDDFDSAYFIDVINSSPELPIDLFAIKDCETERMLKQRNIKSIVPWVLTFDKIFSETSFVSDMREMLSILKQAYGSHVDIEFTTNFIEDRYKINIVQCRPFQITESTDKIKPHPEKIDKENILLRSYGAVIGQSRHIKIDVLIYVVPYLYGKLPEEKRHEVAAKIGEITKQDDYCNKSIMLIGPGRWGTSTPSLGIPVSFSQIHRATALCEIDFMHEGLIPDLSIGTHFFNEMVEMNMLYIAYFKNREKSLINQEMILNSNNYLNDMIKKEQNDLSDIIKVIETQKEYKNKQLMLYADSLEQESLLYFKIK